MASGANRDGSILFLSCDLQNSTQFKQNEENDWIKTFQPYPVFALERELDEVAPSLALAPAFNDSTLITDEYPSRKPSDVLEAISAYRAAKAWQGAIHTPEAHAVVFQNHQLAVEMRSRLDNDIVDTSEDPLLSADGPGDEDVVGVDLPRD